MKKILLAVSAMTLMTSGMAFAEAQTPVIDQRPANQEQQTDKGIASGQLKGTEVKPLNKQQEQVNKMGDKAKPGTVMTEEQKKEWAKIGPPQSRTSRINASHKHDSPGRHR